MPRVIVWEIIHLNVLEQLRRSTVWCAVLIEFSMRSLAAHHGVTVPSVENEEPVGGQVIVGGEEYPLQIPGRDMSQNVEEGDSGVIVVG
jgi:hypothetical protein